MSVPEIPEITPTPVCPYIFSICDFSSLFDQCLEIYAFEATIYRGSINIRNMSTHNDCMPITIQSFDPNHSGYIKQIYHCVKLRCLPYLTLTTCYMTHLCTCAYTYIYTYIWNCIYPVILCILYYSISCRIAIMLLPVKLSI